MSTPESLKNTIWWSLSQQLGLRGRELDHDLRVEELVLGIDNDGHCYYKYVEPPTKSRPKGLNHKAWQIDAKMYHVGGERCPVTIFESYLAHRPTSLQKQGYVYMASLKVARGDVWYSEVKRDGVNYISKFIKGLSKV